MRKIGRTAIVALIGAPLALALAFGGVALANRPAAVQDFAPFAMRVTWWTSTAIQRDGQSPQPGTAVQLLTYQSIDRWKLTLVSSSWDPSSVGTAIEVDNGTHATFYAQASRLVSRPIPQSEGKMAPYRWLIPGLMDEIVRGGFVRSPVTPAGTETFIERSATTVVRPDGTTDVLHGTIVVFDAATRLPQTVETYRDGALRQSIQFELLNSR